MKKETKANLELALELAAQLLVIGDDNIEIDPVSPHEHLLQEKLRIAKRQREERQKRSLLKEQTPTT